MTRKQPVLLRYIEGLTEFSYGSLLLLWLVQALAFAAIYCALSVFVPEHGPRGLTDTSLSSMAGNSVYFSIMTATTVGYGDIAPEGISKFFAGAQAVLALFLWALFVTKLVTHKQDVALKEIHRLSYEEMFHHVREGLFIIRKDFDRMIHHSQKYKELSEYDWVDLTIAYQQGQSLLQEIPELYANDERGSYTLDQRREKLLHEAVHRTLHRLNELLNSLSKANVPWSAQKESMQELEEFLRVVEAMTAQWEQGSPYTEVFEDIRTAKKTIHDKLAQTAVKGPRQKKTK
jgi:hypothetical protein